MSPPKYRNCTVGLGVRVWRVTKGLGPQRLAERAGLLGLESWALWVVAGKMGSEEGWACKRG